MLRIKSAFPNVLIVLALTLLAADKPKLVKVKVAERITISIPQDWKPMDAMDFTQRYPSVRAPLAAYTNDERTADFSVNISATQWPDSNIEMAREFFKSSLLNTFDKVDMIQEGVHEINKKKFAYFEFESRVNGNRQQEGFQDPILRYTYIQYLVEPGKTLVFSFNCPRRIKDQWQETAREMMKAIKIK
ncbi:hypothetical protein [Ohtaekwangia sp.]|uniref:hypothetical protein n=1 Tax=Ohtaekwangia sp. TaxID=2066019 RepID=UPI002F94F654